MCGIVGLYNSNTPPTLEELAKMVDAIKHRGPDFTNHTIIGKVGLGHARLSIIDTSAAANQPMTSADERYTIVYNGEVYNFKEIKEELNVDFKTTSDTEVVLQAFIKWGVDCYQHLNGMFDFAIFDKQTEELFLFRDRIGIKPLFYYQNENTFAFSSEIKGITANSSIKDSLEINKSSISSFLHLGYIPEPETIYNNIKKFPAGAVGIFKDGELKISQIWSPNEAISNLDTDNYDQTKSNLKKLINSAVGYRMVSDVPYGTFLSGGIDSSLITAMAQSQIDQSVKTFSLGIKDSNRDESQYAKQVAEHLNTDHHELMVSVADIKDQVASMIETFDEPFADSSAFLMSIVSKLARKEVKMVLSGDGGDELFMGYGAYKWADRLNKPLIKALKKPISSVLNLGNNRAKRAAGVFNSGNNTNLKSHIFSQEQYYFSEEELSTLLVEPDLNNIDVINSNVDLSRTLSAKEAQALFDLNYYLKDDLLVKVDRASMKYGLEVRTPLLDHRIVEYVLNINEKYKEVKGETKYILKDILYDYIPKAFFDRPKQGFSIPLNEWLLTDLSFLIDDYLSEEAVEKANIVKFEEVNNYVKDFRNGANYLYNRIWTLILLHKWVAQAK
ncbi:MAG: asparagine synthase (glutamine-hydrolyzing) [Flavobacteriales bacterium]|nr:asparagine synthase (glutamine-hydrolyzing) [Flavobacteriales bacterium]